MFFLKFEVIRNIKGELFSTRDLLEWRMYTIKFKYAMRIG